MAFKLQPDLSENKETKRDLQVWTWEKTETNINVFVTSLM